MEVVTVVYSRINLLDDSIDSEYKYQANCAAEQIYEKIAGALQDIKRVDAVIATAYMPSTGTINVIRFIVDNRHDILIGLDRCLKEGAAFYADRIIQFIQGRLIKSGQEVSYNGSYQ